MRTLAIAVMTALVAVTGAAFGTPHIDYLKPFRLLAQPSGGAAEITIFGTFPMATEGHPDRAEYEPLRVSAADGVVTIAGQVAPGMQQRITAIASSVADVKSVKWGQ